MAAPVLHGAKLNSNYSLSVTRLVAHPGKFTCWADVKDPAGKTQRWLHDDIVQGPGTRGPKTMVLDQPGKYFVEVVANFDPDAPSDDCGVVRTMTTPPAVVRMLANSDTVHSDLVDIVIIVR